MHILVLNEGSLTTNLSANFVVRKTGSGEKGDFLSSSNGVHDVDGGDTCLDHFLGVLSLERIDWLTLDVEEVFSEHSGALINRDTGTIELAAKHFS